MNRFSLAVFAALLAAGSAIVAQTSAQADKQLAAAQHKATVDGDLNGAIEMYQKIVAGAGANRASMAQALLGMAECHRKLGNEREARAIYERIAREFEDQAASATTARNRLAAMQSPAVPHAGQVARQLWAGYGANESASVSPDGRYMSFIGFAVDDKAFRLDDVGIRDLLTGTVRRLTHAAERRDDGRAVLGEYSVISRDGRQVAYVWYKQRVGELRILPLTAGEADRPRIVYRTRYLELFDWTPDGKNVLVVLELMDRTWQIAFISIADGSVRALKTLAVRARNSNQLWERPNKVSLSPDGRHVAYDLPVRDAESARDIFVLNANGSQETVVVEHRANDRMPVWSTDGSQLLFVSDRTGKDALWRAPIEAGRPKGPAVLVREELAAIVPLGTTRSGVLYYVVDAQPRSNVYVAALDAAMKVTGAPSFATDRFVGSNGGPAWSHDGQYLAYRARRGLGAGAENVLVIRTLRTGEERDIPLSLSIEPRGGAGLKWFPDGRSVLVVAREQTPRQGRYHAFYRIDVTSGRAEPLLSTKGTYYEFSDPGLSPNGRTIFYVQGEDSERPSRELVRFDLDSRREVVLKRGPLVSGAVAVSPDGADVAYVVMNPSSSRMEIEVMPASGGEPRKVSLGTSPTRVDPIGRIAWSPDQRFLLFVRGAGAGPGSLWRVAATGGEPEDMGISGLMMPRVHPDGRRIAFEVPENLPPSVWTLENFLPRTGAAR